MYNDIQKKTFVTLGCLMKRIAILGCENSHADQFLNFIRSDEKYSDVEVVGIFSEEKEAEIKLSEKHNVPILSSIDEAVGKIDGLIVTARDGKNHFPYAKNYISKDFPMFIDKPITSSEKDAVEFMRFCRDAKVRLTGGSSCVHTETVQSLRQSVLNKVDGETIGGIVRGPVSMHNNYGDFWFYAQHVTEILCEIFGRFPVSVQAFVNGKKKTVVFRYEQYDITALFVEDNYVYSAERMNEKGIEGGVFPVTGNSSCFKSEFDEFYGLLCGAAPRLTEEEFIAPVFVMSAIERSLNSGKEEKVNEIHI